VEETKIIYIIIQNQLHDLSEKCQISL